ncbi:MAG: aminodeoxychorismate/anthranilate synthase component II [Deltaproteobacteria bacterium]|nr:aminodeoxychorismate/anthranilate synthase component II [Deltaproteobacteria bacterium]
MILLIDNYDSFTYNLFHYLGEIGAEVQVYRNDKITLEKIAALKPEKIVISPGPCTPKEAGISCDVIRRFGDKTPILGVCLGHQCIGAAFGGEIVRAPTIDPGRLPPELSISAHTAENVIMGVRHRSYPIEGVQFHPESILTEEGKRLLKNFLDYY